MNADQKLKEYDNLKNEINQKMALRNTLITFTITTTIAVLTLALSQNIFVTSVYHYTNVYSYSILWNRYCEIISIYDSFFRERFRRN